MAHRRFALGLAAWRRAKRQWGDQIPRSVAFEIALTARWNSAFRRLQEKAFAGRIADAKVVAPIFVIGHWRSGTTLLHELLSADPQFAFPSTQACMNPHYFLFAKDVAAAPAKSIARPMDGVVISADSPQEDEFALLNLGLPSPYEAFLFPEALHRVVPNTDLGSFGPAEQTRWRHVFHHFLKAVSVAGEGRRLILKSPTHSLRVPFLTDLFPDARFVHIVRNPLDVYPSAVRMWKEMIALYRIGAPVDDRAIADAVMRTIPEVDEAIASVSFAPRSCVRVQYEALVADPMGTLESIYDELQLGGFAAALPHLSSAVRARAWRRASRTAVLPPPERARLLEISRPIMERYGYSGEQS
jgi:hypothetical protein